MKNRLHTLATLFSLATLFLFASCDPNTIPPGEPTPDPGTYTGTVSVSSGTPDEFTLEEREVVVTLAADRATADIEMMQVKFHPDMPVVLNVLIEGVTLTPAADGYTLSCPAGGIIPSALNGRPFPDYTMTAITGTVTSRNLSVSMMCGEYPMSFTGVSTGTAE